MRSPIRAANRLWQLTDSDSVHVLSEILSLEASLAGLKLQVLGAIDERDVTTTTTGLGTAAWLHATARQSLATAHRDVAIARALHHRFGRLTSAMANGDVSAEQAVAVVGVLKDLPVDLDHDQVVAAEETMVEFAAQYGPRELRALAGHLLEVVAPDVAEAAEGEILERQDREARRSQYLRWRDDGDGALQFSGKLPTVDGEQLRTLVEAIAHDKQGGQPRTVTSTNRRGSPSGPKR